MSVHLQPMGIAGLQTAAEPDALTARREDITADDPGYEADDLGAASSNGRGNKSYNLLARQRIEKKREEAHKEYVERQRAEEAQRKELNKRKEQPLIIEID